jgi:vacuolar-type H+-ATPase subunit F/Vma7
VDKRIVFLGDELTASAYRLAGFSTAIVEPERTADELDAVAESGPALVLLASTHAKALGMEGLSQRIRLAQPPIMVVVDARHTEPLPDFTNLIRRRLGVAT